MTDMLRYVVLRHEGVPEPHFDLMFETSPGSPLATWRSQYWPLHTGAPLTPLPDHRAEYLTFEGEISGGRGTVRRVAEGRHSVISDDPVLLVVELVNENTVLRLFRGNPTHAQVLRE